jgi:hypothetical protein
MLERVEVGGQNHGKVNQRITCNKNGKWPSNRAWYIEI